MIEFAYNRQKFVKVSRKSSDKEYFHLWTVEKVYDKELDNKNYQI